MQRRKFVLGLGSLTAAGAAAVGSGAFTTAEATRDVSVEVADDSTGYLAIQQSGGPNSKFASQAGNGTIGLNFSGSGNSGGGVGTNSVYNFDNVFSITNQGTQAVYVWVNFSGSTFDDSSLYLYPNGSRDTKLNDGSNSVLALSPGEEANIGVHVDTESITADGSPTMTIKADVDKPGTSESVGSDGDQTLVVSQNPDQGDFSSIQAAIDASDGTTIYVEPGRYEEDLSISKDITLVGAQGGVPAFDPSSGTTRSADDLSGETVLDSSGSFDYEGEGPAALNIGGGASITVDGFTLANNGYFVDSDHWGNLVMKNSILTNSGTAANGHIDLSGYKGGVGSLTFRNNYITENSTSNGIRIRNSTDSPAVLTIEDNLWENNRAWAMNLNYSRGSIKNNTFRNTTEFSGTTLEGQDGEKYTYKQWGIIVAADDNDLTIQNNTFDALNGPGVNIYGSFTGTVNIDNNAFNVIKDDSILLIDRQTPDQYPAQQVNINITDNSFTIPEDELAINNEIPNQIAIDVVGSSLSLRDVSEGVNLN
ncbi:right-handed parallel beta-helix repeat-containing protein [Halorubrum coriense]|uniref:right-handed parallel beta-helix repeat-containing protein n=1 Tax=Halorubrum coriense TaxID=64713 RepID=UPI0009B5D0AE|nr:right-handed parallel beta-helix repeat-containing protein [Halorubrum coriense]